MSDFDGSTSNYAYVTPYSPGTNIVSIFLSLAMEWSKGVDNIATLVYYSPMTPVNTRAQGSLVERINFCIIGAPVFIFK